MSYPVSTSVHFRFDENYQVPLEKEIERIIRCGFRFLDFNFLDWNSDRRSPFTGEHWESWITGCGETAAKNGAVFNQAHAPCHDGMRYDGMTDADFFELQVRAIKGCAMLGIPWMVYHPIYTDSPDWMRINHEIFDPLAEVSRKYGVGMALENTWISRQNVPLWRTENLIALADSFADPIVGICWDVGHCNMTAGRDDLKEYTDQYRELTKVGKRLKALHIHDNSGCRDDHIAPFDGNIDWDSVMRALRDIGYEHSFTYEAHNAVRRIPEGLVDERIAYLHRLGETMVRWDGSFPER